jgi:hypothetical protein
MPEKQTPERGLPVPDGQNNQPEGGDGLFELQLKLFELKQVDRSLQRERERHRREEEALTEAQRESQQESLKADELERASNESTQKLIELDLQMGKGDQLKAVVEGKDIPNVLPLREAAKNDRALAQIIDAYDTMKELYKDSTSSKVWPPKTPQQRHVIAASAVAMRELLVLGQVRVDALKRGVKSSDNMWQKAQRRIPLGASSDAVAARLTTDAAVDATFKELATRASALFGTPSKPGIESKMAELSSYLPDDPRALGIAEGFMIQLQRFASLTQKKGADGKVTSSISSDPTELSQVEDALTWMEQSANALKRYASENSRVKQYLDGTLPKAVIQPKQEDVLERAEEVKTVKEKTPHKIPTKTEAKKSADMPEGIAEDVSTVPTADKAFQQWEEKWIESGKNSFFDQINTRYKAFREIRRNDRENELIVSTYDKLLPMLKQYAELESAIPRLTGQEAKTSDMRAIEQILIDIEAALTEFESAWNNKDVTPATSSVVPKKQEVNLKPGSELDLMVKSQMQESVDSSEKDIPTPKKKRERKADKPVEEKVVPAAQEKIVPQEIPVQQNVVRQSVTRENLPTSIEGVFADYREMLADRAILGGSIEWRTYAQEAKQLTSRYLLCLSNGNYPTDQKKMNELLTVVTEFRQLMDTYKEKRGSLPKTPQKESEKPWHIEHEEFLTWRQRISNVTPAFNKLKTEFESSDNPRLQSVYKEFDEVMSVYSRLYKKLTAKEPFDERQLTAVVGQMERVLHYYEPKLRDSATMQTVSAESKNGGGFLGGLLNKATAVVSDAVQSGSEDPELQRKFMEKMFNTKQSRFEIRRELIKGTELKPLPKLSEEELASLVYLKAHLPDFAGKDGKLNGADLRSMTDILSGNVMRDPWGLYNRILQERGFHPGSQEARGIRMALGLDGLTQKESYDLNRGRRAINSPLMRLFMSRSQKAQLASAEQGLARVNQTRSEIPAQVRQKVEAELRAFIEKSHLAISNEPPDSGHGSITEADMRAFEKHTAVLKGVSDRALKDVRELTGATIETYLPDGLSVEFIDWMLDAQARPSGFIGSATGSAFWIEKGNQAVQPQTPNIPQQTPSPAPQPQNRIASQPIQRQPEVTPAKIVSAKNGQWIHFIDSRGNPTEQYHLDTSHGQQLSMGTRGLATFNAQTGEWSMQLPNGMTDIRTLEPVPQPVVTRIELKTAPAGNPSVAPKPTPTVQPKIETVKPVIKQIDAAIPSEFLEKIDVPKNLQERFNLINKAYSDLYKKVFSPNYRIKEEQYLDQITDLAARSAMVRDVENLKTEVRNQLVHDWHEARAAFANASKVASNNGFSFGNLLKPSNDSAVAEKFIAARAEEYKAAKSDVERAQMFAEDAKLRPFLPLTAKQVEALILMKALLPKITGPDGKFNTKDDMAGYAKGKREMRDAFGTAYPEVSPFEQQFADAAEIIDTIGAADRRNPQSALKQLEKAFGATIKTDPMNGLNSETIDWMLAAQKSPTAPTGLPAGMTVRFGKGEQIEITNSAPDTGSVGPEVNLGEPETK